jgi:hypothetical protein
MLIMGALSRPNGWGRPNLATISPPTKARGVALRPAEPADFGRRMGDRSRDAA